MNRNSQQKKTHHWRRFDGRVLRRTPIKVHTFWLNQAQIKYLLKIRLIDQVNHCWNHYQELIIIGAPKLMVRGIGVIQQTKEYVGITVIVQLWGHLYHFLLRTKLVVWPGEFAQLVELVHLRISFSKSHDKKCDRISNKSRHKNRRQKSMQYFSKIYSPDNRNASHKEFPWQVLIPGDDIRCAGTLVKLDVSDFLSGYEIRLQCMVYIMDLCCALKSY